MQETLEPKSAEDILAQLQAGLPEAALVATDLAVSQPYAQLAPPDLPAAAHLLKTQEGLYFDMLECISGVDYGPETNRIGAVYHFCSIPFGHRFVLKAFVDRHPTDEAGHPDPAADYQPTLPTLMHEYGAAIWHEREVYDLFGIFFEGHDDMRRMMLPEDWEGHPLRKDYQTPDYYHNIQVDY
jgi:NADH-quinone oxidoreductase subunit C